MKHFLFAVVLSACSLTHGGRLTERIAKQHTIKATDVWYGGERTVFDFDGYDAWMIEPPANVKAAAGNPWTWTMQWREAFVPRTGVPQLLAKGWHHVAIDTFKHRMDEKGLEVSRRFQTYVVNELGLSPKACLIGMSWGGFFSIRYAAACPQNVAKIYLDCPLLNLGGGCGKKLSIGDWEKNPPASWLDDPRMPVNLSKPISDAGIPVLLVYGGADDVLSPALNSEVFIPRFKAAGGVIRVVRRALYAHHPHGFEESSTEIPYFFIGGKQ